MGRPIKHFTIVGGGTAGWIAAAYLNKRLQWGPTTKREQVKITVIESPQIGVIGVGEATVPTIKATLQHLEIPEPEFMSRADATFKLGIWFDRWNFDAKGELNGFIHPFTGGRTINGIHPGYPFKMHGIPDHKDADDQDFVRTISFVREAFEKNLGPRALSDPYYGGPQQYAYHIDAAKFANYLAEICKSRGVEHVRDNVVDVKLNERGFISALKLEKNGDWPVEMVIDCTGFRGLIINKALNEPFIPFSEYLLNDRAIPMQVRHWEAQRIPNVTRAVAMDAGWVWHIPLKGRVGAGYVFCSRFKSDEEALAEMREYLGPAACEGIEPQPTIRMRVGRNRRCWVKNCVAIGLSGGFLEPLESTAIMTLELQSRMMLHYLPSSDFEEPLADHYNDYVARLYEEVRDFLSLHYSLSERKGPYWDAVRNEARKSDSLASLIELWKYALPSPADPRTSLYVDNWSIIAVLMGKNFYKDCRLSMGAYEVALPLWQRYLNDNEAWKQSILKKLASHNQLIEHMHAPSSIVPRSKAPEDTASPDAELLTQPKPIMARPPAQQKQPA